MSKEKCMRCGEVDYDRRTLWMACFYDMAELDVPFEQVAVKGVVTEKIGEEDLSVAGLKFKKPIYQPRKDAESYQHQFYTLRVCKACRHEWMEMIQEWFCKREHKHEI
jgi:hypothetical protein